MRWIECLLATCVSNRRCFATTGRAGTTFGDPDAAAKGDTSKETQFKKSAGDFSRNDGGAAPPDLGSTVCPVMPISMCHKQPTPSGICAVCRGGPTCTAASLLLFTCCAASFLWCCDCRERAEPNPSACLCAAADAD